MRGDPRGRTSTWLEPTRQRRQARRDEQLETIERLDAEARRARRTGEYTADIRRW
jgi:hypothetical protein